MVVVDTSGSMIWHFGDCQTTGGDGGNPALFCDNSMGPQPSPAGAVFDCSKTCTEGNGAAKLFPTTITNPSRLYAAKAALNDVINSASGSIDFGLSRYALRSASDGAGFVCPDAESCCSPQTGSSMYPAAGGFVACSTPPCPGRCIPQLLNDYPDVPQSVSCLQSLTSDCNLTYLAGCGTSKGCSGSCGNTQGGQILVTPGANSSSQILPWVDFVEDFCSSTGSAGGLPRNPELRAAGPTPLAGAIRTSKLEWYKQIFDHTRGFPNCSPNNPACDCNESNPLCDRQLDCRSYVNVVMTDGVESCESPSIAFTDPQAAVAELTAINPTNPVKTYVIAVSFADYEPCNNPNTDFTVCPTGLPGHPGCTTRNGVSVCACRDNNDCGKTCEGPNSYVCVNGVCQHPALDSLNAMAVAGGTGTARFANSQTDIEAAFADIVASTVKTEICDDKDNDCDGFCDEAPFAGVATTAANGCPVRPAAECNNGQQGECFAVGHYKCSSDKLSQVCDAIGKAPIGESCANLGQDDDCNGVVDDCNPHVPNSCVCDTCPQCAKDRGAPQIQLPETCNGCDDDCDGDVDGFANDDLTDTGSVCGNDVGLCQPGVSACCQEANPAPGSCTVSGTPNNVLNRLVCLGGRNPVPEDSIEECDGADNNCNGVIDEITESCYTLGPLSQVGVGICRAGTRACNAMACGTAPNVCCPSPITNGEPCPGTVPSFSSTCLGEIGPATEVCDGIDNDCDGLLDGNDTLPSPFGEACCSTGTLADCQNTGMGSRCTPGTIICSSGGQVCDGDIAKTNEDCDGIDDDCDGISDLTDVPGIGGPCSDSTVNTVGACTASFVCTGTLNPNGPNGLTCQQDVGPTPELCNGIDDDCNGPVDDSPTDVGGACGQNCPGGMVANCVGACSPGTFVCTNGAKVCSGSTGATQERCDTFDNDCDGLTDGDDKAPADQNGPLTESWLNQACCPTGNLADCTNTGGGTRCSEGTYQCVAGARVCDGGVAKSAEVCNGIDDDCNGLVDDIASIGRPCNTDGVETRGPCTAKYVCTGTENPNGPSGLTCQQDIGPSPEMCNGLDDDCDNIIDNNLADPQVDQPGLQPFCPALPVGQMELPCKAGVTRCKQGKIVCEGYVGPQRNQCDGVSRDCTGSTLGSCEGDMRCLLGLGLCLSPCAPTEFPCPGGFICDTTENLCVPDKCVPNPCAAQGLNCEPGTGACFDACVNAPPCGAGSICKLGRCVDASCRTQGCPAGEKCVGTPPACVADPCFGKVCDQGQFCDASGNCVTPCAACLSDEICVNGMCEPDPCATMNCPGTQVCALVQGAPVCVENQCDLCGAGQACCGGMCVLDPCDGLICPNGVQCTVDNSCNPTCPGPNAERIVGAGGGGVACDVSGGRSDGNGGFVLVAALLGAALLRRRRLGMLVLFAAALSIAGCKSNPFCLNCDETSPQKIDGGPDLTTPPDMTEVDLVDPGDLAERPDTGCMLTNNGVEICDQLDNDCNGQFDDVNPAILQADPNNCGACGRACDYFLTKRFGTCVMVGGEPTCAPGGCLPGYFDVDGDPANGCEYACTRTPDPTEICDGKDNDCNGTTDDPFTAPFPGGYIGGDKSKPLYNSDVKNCSSCGNVCNLYGAEAKCVPDPGTGVGLCVVDRCTNNGVSTYRTLMSPGGLNTVGCLYPCPLPALPPPSPTPSPSPGVDCDIGPCQFPPEVCNGVDDDCDGTDDNNLTDVGGQCADDCPGQMLQNCIGFCRAGTVVCNGGVLDCGGLSRGPTLEVCDTIDNDCDGDVDGILNNDLTDTWIGQPCCPGGNVANCTNTGGGSRCAVGVDQCQSGIRMCQGAIAKAAETCNAVDDDCNGLSDDVPGIGAPCTGGGTNTQGQCTARFGCAPSPTPTPGPFANGLHCLQVVGPASELCNGLDDDCNGTPDNNLVDSRIGVDCGVNCPGGLVQGCVGECQKGTTICSSGVPTCNGSTGPAASDTCNGKDDDCNGLTDDPFTAPFPGGYNGGNKSQPLYNSDVNNCGGCTGTTNYVCALPHAVSGCHSATPNAQGNCYKVSCDSGFHYVPMTNSSPPSPTNCNVNAPGPQDSLPGDVASGVGCFYACGPLTSLEVCDGQDNDCNGCIDNGLPPPTPYFCSKLGVCPSSETLPIECKGASGWKCNYSGVPNIQLTANGDLPPTETLCDAFDNNCNGVVNKDGFATFGDDCFDGNGICQAPGTVACTSTSTVGCNAVANNSAAGPELCNGIDDDCDGQVDERAFGPTFAGWSDPMVKIDKGGGAFFYIYKFEASRPDATGGLPGDDESRACSEPSVLPWSGVTQTQAQAACAAVLDGANHPMRLCTATEWQLACEGPPPQPGTQWSYSTGVNGYTEQICNDEKQSTPDNAAWATGTTTAAATAAGKFCYTDWAAQGTVHDLSGNLSEWTSTAVSSQGVTYYEVRGGAYNSPAGGTACEFDFNIARPTFLDSSVGFRCCSDVAPCGDTDSDPKNCGACGVVCGGGTPLCSQGGCKNMCDVGRTNCSNACVFTATDENNCGTCGNACGAGQTCTSGVCGCLAGYTLCSGRCVLTLSDPNNCGSCGNQCTGGTPVCNNGACAPNCGALTQCGTSCVDTQTNSDHCGVCNNTCTGGSTCAGGACCPISLSVCNGQCVDTQSNNNAHCGGCNIGCASNNCQSGVCCPAGQTNCGGVCVNLLNDPMNCNACGNSCGGGPCTNGSCCGPGLLTCGPQCVDPLNDNNNCGRCFNACPAGQTCKPPLPAGTPGLSGVCCAAGLTNCGGICTNTQTDPNNCGGCGAAFSCGAGGICRNGQCQCPPYQKRCGGVCINVSNDPNNCGACDNVCTGTDCLSSECIGGCQFNGYDDCTNGFPGVIERSCTDRLADRTNCGACGTACTGAQGCLKGGCVTQATGRTFNPNPGPGAGICGANGIGPAITLTESGPPRSGSTCSGDIAATTFTFGVCACDTFNGGGSPNIDAFDSQVAPYGFGGQSTLGGSIGVNSSFTNSSSFDISGDVFNAAEPGDPTPQLNLGSTTILQRLQAQNIVNGNYSVGGAVYATNISGGAGTYGTNATFADDDLHLGTPACGAVAGSWSAGGAGSTCLNETVTVQEPCKRCDAADQVKIQEYVNNYSGTNNDNALIEDNTAPVVLLKDQLEGLTTDAVLELPCGYYYFDAITSTKDVEINVHGNTAIFVAGDVNVGGTLTIYPDEDARVDIFVAGTWDMKTNSRIGNMNVPASTRLYIKGVCTGGSCGSPAWAMTFGGPQILGAGAYAPNGAFNPTSQTDTFGAVFTKDYDQDSGSLKLHYDKAFANQNSLCPPPSGGGCTSCLECSNQACVGVPCGGTGTGVCGACTMDCQCCAPLRCVSGSCQFTDY